MNNIYSAVFTLLGAVSAVGLVVVIRWANDANCTGWRLRQWKEYCNSGAGREWQPWFAWRPVRTVAGEQVWWTTVYRQIGNTYVDHDDWTWYHYGTVIDVLRDTR
jgi:hypothetical protein